MAAAPLHSSTMGAIGCLLAFALSMLCLIVSFFLSTCKYGSVQEDHLLCCGKHVEVFSPPATPVCFRKHTFTQARQLGPEACLVSSFLSHKFGEGDGLVKNWYRLYPLGLMQFSLNSGESQTGGSCLKSHKRTTEIVPNDLSL